MKVDKMTPLTSEKSMNLEKATCLYTYFCGCNSEDSGSSQAVFHWALQVVGFLSIPGKRLTLVRS